MTPLVHVHTALPVSLIGQSVFRQVFRHDLAGYVRGRLVMTGASTVPVDPTSLNVQLHCYMDVRVVLLTGTERNILVETACGAAVDNHTALYPDDGLCDPSDVVCDFEHGDQIIVEARAMNTGLPDRTVYVAGFIAGVKPRMDLLVSLHAERVSRP